MIRIPTCSAELEGVEGIGEEQRGAVGHDVRSLVRGEDVDVANLRFAMFDRSGNKLVSVRSSSIRPDQTPQRL